MIGLPNPITRIIKRFRAFRDRVTKSGGYSGYYVPSMWAVANDKSMIEYNPSILMRLAQRPWIRAAIHAIVIEVLSAGFVVDSDDEYSKSVIEDLFSRPNDGDTFAEFTWKTWESLLATGDCYIEAKVDNDVNGAAILEYIPPQLVSYNSSDRKYTISGVNGPITLTEDDVIHVMIPNPSDPNNGKSPIAGLLDDLLLEEEAYKYNLDFFESGISPTGIVRFESDTNIPFDEKRKMVDVLSQQIRDKRRGVIAIEGGDFEPIQPTNKELEFVELLRMVRDRIIATYGVPPSKIGVFESANLGGGRDERQDKNFRKKLRGWMSLFENAYNRFINDKLNIDAQFRYGDFDYEESLERAQIHRIYLEYGIMTPDEVRKELGLPPTGKENNPEPNLIERFKARGYIL